MVEPYGRAYLERRLKLCCDWAAAAPDPEQARLYAALARNYVTLLAEEPSLSDNPDQKEPDRPLMLKDAWSSRP